MLVPLAAVATVWILGTLASGVFRRLTAGKSRRDVALLDLARFAAGAVLTAAITLVVSLVLTAIGADPRGAGALLDTYVQRNALVVGFVMGFAIIPIIYTIAEDALSAVPEHLRAASLGSGATPWQTAIRIVLPAAMSGLFSAVMIGLGRAVGETMIVLMAAGNTPILEMNIFNGFRTLSANIAVELPEAVRDSTHYRTLFLAALILFAMTFAINTVAELVRLRFRKKSAQI
jgi:phosphate transport system permease protein